MRRIGDTHSKAARKGLYVSEEIKRLHGTASTEKEPACMRAPAWLIYRLSEHMGALRKCIAPRVKTFRVNYHKATSAEDISYFHQRVLWDKKEAVSLQLSDYMRLEKLCVVSSDLFEFRKVVDRALCSLKLKDVREVETSRLSVPIKRIALDTIRLAPGQLADILETPGLLKLKMKNVEMEDPGLTAKSFSHLKCLILEGRTVKTFQGIVHELWQYPRTRTRISDGRSVLSINLSCRGESSLQLIFPEEAAYAKSCRNISEVRIHDLFLTKQKLEAVELGGLRNIQIVEGMLDAESLYLLEERSQGLFKLLLHRCTVDQLALAMLIKKHAKTLRHLDLSDTFVTQDTLNFIHNTAKLQEFKYGMSGKLHERNSC